MSIGNASRFPDGRISAAAARAQLAMLLSGATDERLAGFTVDKLAAMNRSGRKHIEAALEGALKARGLG